MFAREKGEAASLYLESCFVVVEVLRSALGEPRSVLEMTRKALDGSEYVIASYALLRYILSQ